MKTLIIISALLVSTNLFAKGKNCKNYDMYTDVEPTEMTELVKTKKATIIDVNSSDSFKESHIPGAIHYASNSDKLDTLLPKDKNALIVAYCGGKSCTAWQRAAKVACEKGYTNIKHFSSGISGWNKMQLNKMKNKKG